MLPLILDDVPKTFSSESTHAISVPATALLFVYVKVTVLSDALMTHPVIVGSASPPLATYTMSPVVVLGELYVSTLTQTA
jgi:hypothetical protein